MRIGIERHTTIEARDLSGKVVRKNDEGYIYVSRWFGLWKRYVRFNNWSAAYVVGYVYIKLVKRSSLATALPFRTAQDIKSFMRDHPERYIIEG